MATASRKPASASTGSSNRRTPGKRISPGRRQYLQLKAKHSDALLLFRMGDFYECFDEDAHTLAKILDVALTARDVGGGQRSALAGIPHHALDNYLGRLVGAGLKIAVAEQISSKPGPSGVVERAVARIITPGTVLDASLLEQDRHNYLVACVSSGEMAGMAWLEASTGEFAAMEVTSSKLVEELERLDPAEILADERCEALVSGRDGSDASARLERCVLRRISPDHLDEEEAAQILLDHFNSESIEPFDLENRPLAVTAAAAALEFLEETQMGNLPFVTTLRHHRSGSYMHLSPNSLRDLEILEPAVPGGPSLLSTLDQTNTPMGARLLRNWLSSPLLDLKELTPRQMAVQRLFCDQLLRTGLRELLSKVPDLPRSINRVTLKRASPRDLVSLQRGLEQMPRIKELLTDPETSRSISELFDGIADHAEARSLIRSSIVEDPPQRLGDGDVVRDGFDDDLDSLKCIARDARSAIAAIEESVRDSSGIKSLKVGYNRVFGYYIEVSRPNLHLVPDDFQRRQTLVNGERFITPELKELENRILNASERIEELEQSIFRRVCEQMAAHAASIMRTASIIATLDVCLSFADVASDEGWVMPFVDGGDGIDIRGGRHPVVESVLGPGRFVPNDLFVSNSKDQLLIITGPNMSGKSTYIRQAAILTIMAQTGGFVPAESASIGVVDRIFTRIGVSDDIAGGKSTFMVEMVETASMLNQATPRSLAILDEIGRGTSTYDGLAIARSVAEFIHNSPTLGCKALFATHFHEMTALGDSLPRATNLRVAVAEEGEEVAFLYRIAPGGADRSYGVHVARLAGMPSPVVERAWSLLAELEAHTNNLATTQTTQNHRQLDLFNTIDNTDFLRSITQIDTDNLTPIEALNRLYELRETAQRELADHT